jgi:NTE family protein
VKIGLALGSGAARGWAHVGVLEVLTEAGVVPDVICGTSVGALIGAAHLSGQIEALRAFTQGLGGLGWLGLLDISFARGGLVNAGKIFGRLRSEITDVAIEDLPRTFAAVATDLSNGHEVWLRTGSMLEGVWASAAVPGLSPAVARDGRWLVDGALVNPVPVSLCRALGATVVIAVNLNGALSILPRLSRHPDRPETDAIPNEAAPPNEAARPNQDGLVAVVMAQLAQKFATSRRGDRPWFAGGLLTPKPPVPNMLEILAGSIDIMQDRITRSRLAGDPPDVIITPRLGQIGIFDFDRADDLIALGRAATEAMLPAIEGVIRDAP